MIRPEIQSLATPITQLKPHPQNVRQGDVGAISLSLEQHGQYRPIVVQQSTGFILAGNHTYKAAKALKWKDIAATYVDVDDEQALRILLIDNRANDLASYDDSALVNILKSLADTTLKLDGTGFDGETLDQIIADLENTIKEESTNPYSQELKIPQYLIVGEQPQVNELCDSKKSDLLVADINKTVLDDELKEFLIQATTRHIVFNYAKIAEFYPHQTPEVQLLMEKSVLVIIDVDDAIANGYAKFSKTIKELREIDENEGA